MPFVRLSARAALLAFGSAATLSVATSAMAQATPAEPAAKTEGKASTADASSVSEVVVTGYRASLQSALLAKRNSDLPIESIAPEDIGKMPDQNVAESLQRLPGVQIDRSANGQGTAVLIDGLRQNLTTLNGDVFLTGKEFYVSGEGAGGGAGGNSQYNSLEGIPSEEIGGIDVYKNPEASITEGGLGGTIDLKTRDPLAQPMGLSLGGNFRESFAQHEPDSTPNGTLVGSYKPTSRFGITASLSYDDENTHTEEYQDQNRNQWLITNSATGPYTGALTSAGLSTLPGNKYYIDPQLGYFSDIYDQRKTLGASLGLAWKVTDAINTSLIWFYSREDDVSDTYSDKVWFNGQGASPGTLIPGVDPTQPYSIDSNGVVQSGVFNANGAETATLYQHTLSQANNAQWRTAYDNGGPLRGDLDASYAFATSNLQAAQADVEHGLYDTSAGVATSPAAPGCNNGASTCTDATGSHGYEFSYANGGTSGLPSVSYLAPYANLLSNPAYTTFKSNWAWANVTQQRQEAIKGDLVYEPGYLKEVAARFTFGFRYAERDVDQTFGRYLINGTEANGQVAGYTGDPNGGPYLYYQDPGYGTPNIPYSTGLSNPGLVKTVSNFGVGTIIVKNPATLSNPSTYLDQVWAGAGVPNNTEKLFTDGLSSFKVQEETKSGYAMGDIGSPSNRFHLNFGLRITQTNLTINNGQAAPSPTYYGTASWNGVDNNVVPVETKRSYIDVLPSFNFVLDVSDTQKVRFGAARVVSPQDLFSLGLGNSYNFTRQTNARVNTNPNSNLFGKEDGFAFAGGSSGNTQLDPYRATQFNMSYENYFSRTGLVSIAGFYKAVDNFVETQNIATTVEDDFGGTSADVTEPVNAGKGSIYGVELGAQYALRGERLDVLKGFGFAANYTRSMSFSDQATSFTNDSAIPGVAKNAFTGTLYYERAGFSARGSYSWRDKAVNDSLVGSTFAFPNQNGVSQIYQVYSAPYGQLDGQVGYDFNKHVGLVFSVQNLTDEVQHTYLQWPDEPFSYDNSGRRFFLGFKFKE
jgi:iron complex outermembrane receptor protein